MYGYLDNMYAANIILDAKGKYFMTKLTNRKFYFSKSCISKPF